MLTDDQPVAVPAISKGKEPAAPGWGSSSTAAKATSTPKGSGNGILVGSLISIVVLALMVGVILASSSGSGQRTATAVDTSQSNSGAQNTPLMPDQAEAPDIDALAESSGISAVLLAADPSLVDAQPVGPEAEAAWLQQAWAVMPQSMMNESCASVAKFMEYTGHTVMWDSAQAHVNRNCLNGTDVASPSDADPAELAALAQAWDTASWDMQESVCRAGVGRLMIVTQFRVSWESAAAFWQSVC